MNNVQDNIHRILNQINRQNVTLLAVSKTQSIPSILAAYSAGITHFGENYLQEAIAKINELKALPLTWHFIGRIQTNKCNKIAEYFNWVHGVDKLETAVKLNQANAKYGHLQNICVQVNLFNEPQKSGISIENTQNLVAKIINMPNLHLRGLMTILPESLSKEEQFKAYAHLKQILDDLNQEFNLAMDTLSMGMSNDYPEAIKAGSTIIRLGQAIFGPRK